MFVVYTMKVFVGFLVWLLAVCCPSVQLFLWGRDFLWQVPVEFVTGQTGPRKTRAPGPFRRPAPLNGLGRGVFFAIPCPCPRSGPRPTHTPDGSPLKIACNKRGPVQGMSVGGPLTGAGQGLPEIYPPRPCVRSGSGEWKPTPPRPVTNTKYRKGYVYFEGK